MRCEFCEAAATEKELIVAESGYSIVLTTIEPLEEGHLLVIPRRHVKELDELDREELGDLVGLLGRADRMLRKAYNATCSFSYMKHGTAKSQEHLHIHIMPGFVPIREALEKYGFSKKAHDRKNIAELAEVAEEIRSSGKS